MQTRPYTGGCVNRRESRLVTRQFTEYERKEQHEDRTNYGLTPFSGLDDKLNFFFWVRLVLDEQGNVKSALYGKTYGDFMHFRCYLNPTPNDRNVEFNPRRNLLRVFRGSRIVDAP